jgi:hypothetical protein
MKKNYLKCSGFLALSLLLAYPLEIRSVDDRTTAIVEATTATTLIKNSFEMQGRRTYAISFTQFIDALKVFNNEFSKFSHTSSIQDLFTCVKNNLESFPPTIRELFASMEFKEFDVVARERKAIEYFYTNFLNCQVENVPAWKTLTSAMIPLLDNNTLLYPFQQALKNTQNASGFTGKISIGKALTDRSVKGCVPKPVVEKLESMPLTELKNRVKT